MGKSLRVATVALLLGLLAAPPAVDAQRGGTIRRIGVLTGRSLQSESDAFRESLRQLGWAEGQNVVIEYRSTDGQLLIEADEVIQ